MLRKAAFAERHFDLSDPQSPFCLLEEDPVTKKPVKRVISNVQVKKSFAQLLASSDAGERQKVVQLVDLLDKMMMLDPEKRIDPSAALKHPFCTV